jgi:WD40-like Beta Propeller Repeat/Tetratricopeptide repeat
MTKKLLVPLLLCIVAPFNLHSQREPDYREIFLEAESYFLFEEYNEALPLYLRINEKFPDNNNVNYKIGVCYLNDAYEKEKSISFLELATKDINPKYKENNYKETSAPLEALFYLGNAYRINNQIDKAIETYQKFKELADPKIYDHKLVDEQINACNNATDLETRPVDIDIINLGDRINTHFSDIDPVISGDETKLVYVQRQQFYDAVFFSEKVNGDWSYPRNIIPELGVDEDAYPTSLSYDGNTLLIYRSDNFIGDLYFSTYSNGTWSKLVKLNANINTKYWESHACLTKNSDTLYFTSNRKGGYGGLDIYYSTRDAENQWGIPVNLGNVINTEYNEETPFITADGKTLYFSSYGHYNMGGYDVFYSSLLNDGTWSVPINAGFPINTTDDDIFFVPSENGIFAYFPRFLSEGLGRTDIYKIEIFSGTHPRKFRIHGLVSYPIAASILNPVKVKVVDHQSGDTVALSGVNSATGEFNFIVPSGQYKILVEGQDILTDTSSLEIPKGFKGKDIELENAIELTLVTKPEEILQPKIVDKIKLTDSIIYVTKADPVRINMSLEKNSLLYVDIYHDTLFSNKDSIRIERRRFVYSYKPVPGKNILKLKLLDEDGNLSYKDVLIYYNPEKKKPVIRKEEPVKKEQVVVPSEIAKSREELEKYQQSLIENADGKLKSFLEKIDIKKTGIISESALIDYLKKNAEKNGYSEEDVNDLVTRQFQTSYINQYIDQLQDLTGNEALRNTLSNLDPAKEGIKSLQDLYDYLIKNAETGGYETNDVNNMFTKLSQRTELMNLLENLKKLSTGGLKDALENLDPDRKGIRNPIDLMNYLLKNSDKYGYSESDAMNLLFNYLEKEDLNEIVKILIGTSSGPLQELLIRLNLESAGIGDINDLFNYLLAQAKYNNYTENEVIRLFLNLLNLMDNHELIKKVEPSQIPAIQPTTEKKSHLVYYLAGAGLLVLILIIILLARRKDKKQKKE